MKIKKLAAAAVSAVIALSSLSAYPSVSAETTDAASIYTLSYDLSEDGVVVEDAEVYASVEIEGGDIVTVADGIVQREGYTLTGWTLNHITMYEAGDTFVMPEKDIVLEPVWINPGNEDFYKVNYYVEIDGVVQDTSDMSILEYQPGSCVVISSMAFSRSGYMHTAWTDGTTEFNRLDKMIMPDHDVTLSPVWKKELNVIYDAGTEDRIVGNRSYVFPKLEGAPFELANTQRLVRQGFSIAGWHCELDGQDYKPLAEYVMPSTDITFTAIWKPITYTVVFKVNNGTSSMIKIAGETDSAIIAPECNYTKTGYKFAGWSYNDVIYQPGDEFIVPGAMPGLGIMLTGVWVEDTVEEEENCDVFAVIEARQAYINGEITADELNEITDFVMGR